MPTQSGPSDPRNFWRWWLPISRIPVVMPLVRLLGSVFLRLTAFAWRSHVPEHLGMFVLVGEINADLYEARVIAALDVLHAHAPVYLRWLRRSFQILFVDQTLRIMRAPNRPDYWMRVLGVNPYSAWKASPEQLALDLVVEATRARMGRRSRRTRAARIRALRHGFQEMVACARQLPGQGLVEESEENLRAFEARVAKAAA